MYCDQENPLESSRPHELHMQHLQQLMLTHRLDIGNRMMRGKVKTSISVKISLISWCMAKSARDLMSPLAVEKDISCQILSVEV